jgi:vacuolar-type H+-ATPase subunit H
MDTSDSKTKEIWGRQFKIVKNGLDEAEVFSFIGGLIDQNNALVGRLEHLDSLTKLAERTVIEANKQAQVIQKEVEEKANASAASIIAEAEEKARKEVDRIISETEQKAKQSAEEKITSAEKQARETLKAAEERAESIKSNADDEAKRISAEAKQNTAATEQQAQEILKAAGERAESVKSSADAEAKRINAEAKQNAMVTEEQAQETLKAAEKKAESIKIDAEQEGGKIISQAREKAEELVKERVANTAKEAQSILENARAKAEEEATIIRQKSEQLLRRSKTISESEIKEKLKKVYQSLLSSLEDIEETTVIPIEEEKKAEPAKPEPAVHAKVERKTKEVQKRPAPSEEKVEAKESHILYEGIIELVIPPPLGLDRMLQLHKHLRNIPNIEVLNLGVSADKSITIRVKLESPTPLRSILEDLSEVETTEEAPQDAKMDASTKKPGDKIPIKRIVVSTKK